MNKLFIFLVELFFWIATVLSSSLLSFIIGIVFYIYASISSKLFVLIVCVGVIIGVFIAEKIRKKYGCSNFWGRILATDDIWPNPSDKNSNQ
jgi:hypothetical protein